MQTALQSRPLSSGLFAALVERHLRARTKRSLIGWLWPVIGPFALGALYAFVFTKVFEAPVDRYFDFLLAALLPWSFFSTCIGATVTSISSEPDLVRKAPFPYELLPLSACAVHAVDLLLTLLVFVTYLAVAGKLALGVLPVLLVPVAGVILLAMSFAMLTSLIDVYNRDLRHIIGNLLTVWFFLVPIVYSPLMVPSDLRALQAHEPMNLIVSVTRDILYSGRFVGRHVIEMTLLTSGFFLASLIIFRACARNLPKDV